MTDGTWTYTWQNGRELASMTDGALTWSYTYDANGMRTQRSNGTTAYNYVYNGGSLSQMAVGGNTLNFAYDASGIPMMVTYNGTNYYYIVNLQGDVMGIVDSTGTIVVNYTYDAWGKPLSITGSMADTLGIENPLRYRSYVYDQETGLYYLQTRYYDPEIGRFINADSFIATGQGMLGNNMFAYCNNNPINMVDYTGEEPISLTLCGIYLLVAGAVALCSALVVSSPGFQRTWNRTCSAVVQSLTTGLKVIGGAIKTSINWISGQARKIYNSIEESFAKAKVVSNYRSSREIHHIVAQRAPNAKRARNILDAVGIGYNSSLNLVSLKTGLHRRLHTDLYYGWANSVIISAYDSARGNPSAQRRNVITALNTIRSFLLTLDSMAPY